jgi:hypothetical protein
MGATVPRIGVKRRPAGRPEAKRRPIAADWAAPDFRAIHFWDWFVHRKTPHPPWRVKKFRLPPASLRPIDDRGRSTCDRRRPEFKPRADTVRPVPLIPSLKQKKPVIGQ